VSVIENDARKELTPKEDIEKACLGENRKKILQTQNTPAIMGQLARDLEKYSETVQAQAILKGEYEFPEELDQHSRDYIEELKMENLMKRPKAIITTDNFIQG